MNATFLFISNVYSFEMLLEKNNEKKIHSHATKPMRIALRMGKKNWIFIFRRCCLSKFRSFSSVGQIMLIMLYSLVEREKRRKNKRKTTTTSINNIGDIIF